MATGGVSLPAAERVLVSVAGWRGGRDRDDVTNGRGSFENPIRLTDIGVRPA